jgi:hypothetical protein
MEKKRRKKTEIRESGYAAGEDQFTITGQYYYYILI